VNAAEFCGFVYDKMAEAIKAGRHTRSVDTPANRRRLLSLFYYQSLDMLLFGAPAKTPLEKLFV
jgi:hypothetical protein